MSFNEIGAKMAVISAKTGSDILCKDRIHFRHGSNSGYSKISNGNSIFMVSTVSFQLYYKHGTAIDKNSRA